MQVDDAEGTVDDRRRENLVVRRVVIVGLAAVVVGAGLYQTVNTSPDRGTELTTVSPVPLSGAISGVGVDLHAFAARWHELSDRYALPTLAGLTRAEEPRSVHSRHRDLESGSALHLEAHSDRGPSDAWLQLRAPWLADDLSFGDQAFGELVAYIVAVSATDEASARAAAERLVRPSHEWPLHRLATVEVDGFEIELRGTGMVALVQASASEFPGADSSMPEERG